MNLHLRRFWILKRTVTFNLECWITDMMVSMSVGQNAMSHSTARKRGRYGEASSPRNAEPPRRHEASLRGGGGPERGPPPEGALPREPQQLDLHGRALAADFGVKIFQLSF